ncbi:MAG: hypothetical protein H5T44_00070 [Thermoplasmatales archaeon]|nr:hypothetical protein [Thermoplasmatales archaeon]
MRLKTIAIVAILFIALFFPAKGEVSSRKVFAELGTLSWCPHCPKASDALQALSGELDFCYVTLVYDKSEIASLRGSWLRDAYAPMLYIDGGYEVVDYNPGTVYSDYKNAIENASKRAVRNVEIEINAKWLGEAEIEVGIKLVNKEGKPYFGHLRVYIAEINSRWNDYAGKPFRYAFLDYAFNEYVFIREKYEKVKIWDGKKVHGNLTFPDIEKDNIAIIATISNAIPHIAKNPWEKPFPYFLAEYVDAVKLSLLN